MIARSWAIRGRVLSLERPLIMGIVNVTPDSFSDGGRFLEPGAALAHATKLVDEGADILDIGGESTRPGSSPVAPDEEWRRIGRVIEDVAPRFPKVPVSVDTRHASTAAQALSAGAAIVNDVSALGDPAMASTVTDGGAGLVLMHMRGQPATMQTDVRYHEVVREVKGFLRERLEAATSAGIRRESICLDPGLGFGKRTGEGVEDNARLLSELHEIVSLGQPVLVGASRKAFTGNLSRSPPGQRLEGSLAAAVIATLHGAKIIRAHDVLATRRVVDFASEILRAKAPNP